MNPLIGLVTPIVTDLIDRFIPNKSEAQKAKLEMEAKLLEHLSNIDLAQIGVNAEEAKNSNIFISGWRPFIGWICGSAFAYHFILQPLILFIAACFGKTIPTPVFDMDALNTVLMGILGLGGMRTWEKFKKLTK